MRSAALLLCLTGCGLQPVETEFHASGTAAAWRHVMTGEGDPSGILSIDYSTSADKSVMLEARRNPDGTWSLDVMTESDQKHAADARAKDNERLAATNAALAGALGNALELARAAGGVP